MHRNVVPHLWAEGREDGQSWGQGGPKKALAARCGPAAKSLHRCRQKLYLYFLPSPPAGTPVCQAGSVG